jgi:LPXTG-motif cell wall-anchored protein
MNWVGIVLLLIGGIGLYFYRRRRDREEGEE